MTLFFITLAVILILMIIMAIGLFLGRPPISGSCGGYKALDIDCAAGCKNPCEKRLARMAVDS